MKKLVVIVLSVLITGVTNAQIQNEKGLYIDSEGNLFNGTIEKTVNAVKTDFTVKEGVVNGEATYYYASGNKMETGMFTNGQKDQKWTRFNENGTVSAIAFYNVGKKTGTWLVYDETGKKRFEMNYNNGEKSGVWTNWDETGAVASTKNYDPN
ncbi:MAG: toxin-antitoxin system YwqK family antitoxin [Bacteroidia bacterium]|nr:toxin-antitoxin system YwqK family antitoxin [Bacteroidia bacterium]